jgi:peptidoglycan/xylan/chitin deacetylase (PgdA/CDA1 family)
MPTRTTPGSEASHRRLVRQGLLITIALAGCAAPASRATFDEGAVIRGDRSRQEIALIFTGGDYGEGTEHILDVLRDRSIHASFFVTGDYLASESRRQLVRRMVADGHYVGPHSHGHLLYCSWEDRQETLVTEEQFRSDLERNIADLRALGALPQGQEIWFIPPYEWFNRDQVRWAERMGIRLFNFTPGTGSHRDWIPEDDSRFVSSRRIREEILEFERREPNGLCGHLLLLHLGSARRDKMHRELEPLVRALAERGYGFCTVSDLLGAPGESGHEARPTDR